MLRKIINKSGILPPTREDFESMGWQYQYEHKLYHTVDLILRQGQYGLSYRVSEKYLVLWLGWNWYWSSRTFAGNCPDLKTFRLISKLCLEDFRLKLYTDVEENALTEREQ